MAKKTHRARSRVASVPPVRGEAAAVAQPIRPVRPPSREAPKAVDFRKDYHYVIEDLKRIAIIAAALFALLIVLALIVG